jgi:hypothetical protein
VYSSINTNANLVSQVSDVIYMDGYNTVTFTGAVTYSPASTPTITAISPQYGDIFGGYNITLTGTNLGNAAVVIDGITCVYQTSTTTQIICTTGARMNLPKVNSLTISVNGMAAVVQATFMYVLRWSDSRTWGVSTPPVDGDLVDIPLGMTLLVDQNTPNLQGIVVENGTLLFSDEKDLIIQAGFILIKGGKFIAGTESLPYSHQLTFIMYGNLYGAQMPMFGNKGIMCM